MTVRKLDKGAWQQYFDYMSRGLEGIQAEIAAAALPLGDQIETEWLPVLGITYDPKGDVLEIALDGIDHPIYKPREIYVDATAGELMSLEIVDGGERPENRQFEGAPDATGARDAKTQRDSDAEVSRRKPRRGR